jgi:hypothetical protein
VTFEYLELVTRPAAYIQNGLIAAIEAYPQNTTAKFEHKRKEE